MINVKSGLVVWIDVDDVLVKFKAMFHDHINKIMGLNLSPDYCPTNWNYHEIFKDDANFLKIFEQLPPDWPLGLMAHSGAKEFTKQLNELGCHVVLITHLRESMGIYRLSNLIKHEIYFDEIYFTFHTDKGRYAKEVSKRFRTEQGEIKHVFIDDRAKNVVDMFKALPLNYAVTLRNEFNVPDIELLALEQQSGKLSADSSGVEEMYQKLLNYVRNYQELNKI